MRRPGAVCGLLVLWTSLACGTGDPCDPKTHAPTCDGETHRERCMLTGFLGPKEYREVRQRCLGGQICRPLGPAGEAACVLGPQPEMCTPDTSRCGPGDHSLEVCGGLGYWTHHSRCPGTCVEQPPDAGCMPAGSQACAVEGLSCVGDALLECRAIAAARGGVVPTFTMAPQPCGEGNVCVEGEQDGQAWVGCAAEPVTPCEGSGMRCVDGVRQRCASVHRLDPTLHWWSTGTPCDGTEDP